MNKFKLYLYVFTIVLIVAVIWVIFFLNIKVSDQVIPTLVNGITSSMSVIVGFCGALIGIMFREIDKNDSKTKVSYIVVIVVLSIPLTMLWTTYCFLTMGMSEFAVRYGLSGLIFALYIFFAVVIYAVTTLSDEKRKTSNSILSIHIEE
jgi:Ca2+/Na+ antiporter